MKLIKASVGIAILATAVPAFAQEAGDLPANQAEMLVTATVTNSCVVAATPMNFGVVDNLGSADITSNAEVVVLCTPGATYGVELDDGDNFADGSRKMLGAVGGDTIPYDLAFVDGGALGGLIETVSGVVGTGLNQTYNVQGTIPSSAGAVQADAYTDTVTVTVNF